MLSTACRAQPQTRLLQARPSASTALLQSRGCNQTREFCFGAWYSYFGIETPAGGRRRRRMPRYRHTEALHRHIAWGSSPKAALKKAMAHASGASSSAASHKYADVDKVKSWSDDISGLRPGANIEDVERGAIDHLISSDKNAHYAYDVWKTPLNNIRDFLASQRADTTAASDDAIAAKAPGADGSIDPITNRRADKSTSSEKGSAPLNGDLDGYRSADVTETPAAAPDQPKYNDLQKYAPIEDESFDVKTAESEAKYEDLREYGASQWNEPDGLRKTTPEEESKNYNDLKEYASTTLDEPGTARKLIPEEESKCYDDLKKYQPVEWNEPDGLRKETAEELSKNYDDLHQYGAVHWNEPDGLREHTPEEISKNYYDVDQYGPIRWSEPDGLRRLTPEEESKAYDDLSSYNKPFVAENSTMRAYHASQLDRTVKGTPRPPRVDAPIHDPAEEYQDLDKYGPVRWNEPDGLRKLTPEELSKKYEDLHMYGAVRWNEPDGLRELTPEEASKQYKDAPLYASRDLAGSSERVHPEEASKQYKDLPGYRAYENAGPSIDPVHPEEASKKYEDLGEYSAFDNSGSERRIHPEEASKQYRDLSGYEFGPGEATGAHRVHPEELTKNYNDLDRYQPTSFDAVDKPYPMHPEEATKAYTDLSGYHKAPPSTLDGIASGMLAPDTKACSQEDDRTGPSFTHDRRDNSMLDSTESTSDMVEGLTAEDVRAATLERARDSQAPDESLRQAQEQEGRPRDNLTGNYVRDFPEEFSKSWSASSSTLLPDDASNDTAPASADHDSAEAKSMDESFPMEDLKMQSALDRHLDRAKHGDGYSREPVGLETSYMEECGGKTMPVSEKHFEEKTPVSETASYKIVAFDPVSQTVSMAEASSTPSAGESTSNLAEVLLKLSHPSKFLPYLETLQAEGYDVVSGSGDILIFRRMRAANEDTGKITNHAKFGSARINPIDMMGKPAVGNFASTTGFVNYDALSESPHKPAPPFRSEAAAQEEEAPKASEPAPGGRKKRRIGRKLVIGAAGLAGSAYAVAVLAEYFSTRSAPPKDGGRRL